MKKIIVFSILTLLISISCKKKKDNDQPVIESNINYTGTGAKSLVSKDRLVQNFGGSGIYIANNAYTYDANLVRKTIHSDSTFSGTNWSVSSNTTTYNYNGVNKWNSTHSVYSSGTIYNVAYVYDINGKLQFEIQSTNGSADTTEYVHTGSQTNLRPLHIPVSAHSENFYTDGDLDSTLNFVGVSVYSKQVYTYHGSNLNKTFLAWAASMPLTPANKEITGSVFSSPGSITTTNYTYNKNSNGYPTLMTVASPGQTYTIVYNYL